MMSATQAKRLSGLVKKFPGTRVLVVGDVMVDHYVRGSVTRISPEAPVPVVNVIKETMLLGAAANVVNNVHSLGGDVSLCGVIGHDDAGRRLQHLLRERGISTDGLLVDSGRQTTIKTRVIAHHQQVVRFDRETKDGIDKETHARIFEYVKERVEDGLEAIVLSDYCKGVVTSGLVRDIVRLARRKKLIVSVDPKVSHFGIYSGVTILTPNAKEASIGAGIEIEDEESLLQAGRKLLKRLSCQAVLITRGECGMSLFERNGLITHIPTMAREVFDVTGAGDTVIGALTLAMAAGARVGDAAMLSNFAAGIVVGHIGTATVEPEQLLKRINEAREDGR